MVAARSAQDPAAHDPAPVLRALSDAPVEDHVADGLTFAPYADALAGLLDHPDTGTPLTLAINAPWGAGKSTLGHMLRQRLREKPAPGDSRPHITCWFNAWMHDDAPSLSTAFAAEVARAANAERHPLRRILSPLPRALWARSERWFFWLSLLATFSLLFAGLLVAWEWLAARFSELEILAALATGDADGVVMSVTSGTSSRQAVGVGGVSVLLTALVGRVPRLISAARSVAGFIEDPQAAATLGCVADVRAQLGMLIQQARRGSRRFVVFVDDLERCHPPRSIDLLEVVNQLLDHEGVVVVIMADLPAVAACADIKYKELAALHSPGDAPPGAGAYGRLYVHKIVQLQFDLPPNTRSQLDALLARLAAEPASAGHGVAARPARGSGARSIAQAVLRRLPGGERRARQRLARLREQIDRAVAAGASEAELAGLCERAGMAGAAPALLRERRLMRLMDDAQLLHDAHAEVAGYLAPYPRSLKRFLNHVRILSAVAHARGVLAPGSAPTVRHIARWAVLKERWPLVAGAVLRRPSRLLELERAARSEAALGELLRSWGAESWDAAELSAFAIGGTVTIGECAEQLVQLVPAPLDARAPRVPTVSMRTGALGGELDAEPPQASSARSA